MALRSPSSTPLRDLGPRDSPPADSPPSTSQGGSGDGATADVSRKTKEVEHLLANLEKEGVEIDAKIASIIDDEIARIETEVEREIIDDSKWNDILIGIASVAVGFFMGVEWLKINFRKVLAKRRRA